ncbi:MAG: GGDEF domain-containing protein [Desulfomonilaceae bacterium]
MNVQVLLSKSIATWLAGRSKTFLILLGVGIVLLIGVIDHLTGEEISVAVFYLVPAALVTWYVGRWAGVFISCLSGVTWLISDWTTGHHYSHPLILYWNAVVTLAFFLAFTIALSAVKKALEAAKRSARTEPLTGISNSRAFSEVVDRELDRARRYRHSLSFAYIDLDDFKAVNDRYGHSIGDLLLQAVANTIKKHIRETDTVARLGGDEFGILLPETGPKAARHFIERIRDRLSHDVQGSGWPVTFSIGVVTFMSPPIDVNEAIRIADSLMYSAKNSGKNTIKFEILGQEMRQPTRADGVR